MEETSRPIWKNPYVVGFLVGIAMLTVLPVLQRRMLRAPPPLSHLSSWSLPTLEGGPVGSESLLGFVWIAGLVPVPCDPSCVSQQQSLQDVLKATSDLARPVKLLTVVAVEEERRQVPSELQALSVPGKWSVAYGTYEELAPLQSELRQALWAFRGEQARGVPPAVEALPGFVLVDQNGDVRGFWGADELSRGNLINAARMLNRYGPNP